MDALLTARGLASNIDEVDRIELLSVWRQMVPWPDSVDGIAQLRRKVVVAALTNVDMTTVIAITKRGGLSFDALLTGDLLHSYKPSPETYREAAAFLALRPAEIMMVAAHKFDLKAAKAAGFMTAYIPRPLEFGPQTKVDRSTETYIDVVADDLADLARRIYGN